MTAAFDILLFTLGVTFFYSLLSRVLVKPEEIRAIKKEIEEYKNKSNEAKKEKNTEKMNQAMSEILKANSKLFRKNMKPMIFSFVIFILALGWLGNAYAGAVIFLPFSLPFFGQDLGWFWWYLIIAIPSTIFFRKLIGLE